MQRFPSSVHALLVLSRPQNASILPALGFTAHGRRGRDGTGIPSERQQETSQDTRGPGAHKNLSLAYAARRAKGPESYMKHVACHLFQVTQILRPPGRH